MSTYMYCNNNIYINNKYLIMQVKVQEIFDIHFCDSTLSVVINYVTFSLKQDLIKT
jgi:hypothetical protein